MMEGGSVITSWDPWVDPTWPHSTCVSQWWQVTDHVYYLVNSRQYLQVELIVAYIVKSAIFGLVREVCFGVACPSSAWDMANELSKVGWLALGSQDSPGWNGLQKVSSAGNVL